MSHSVCQTACMINLSKPTTVRNLTAWFVTSPSASRTYAVLEEAMERHPQLLHETGNVNQLLIENPGDLDLFIQAGDIVKGGRQDRTIGSDFIVPAKSEPIPVPAFCVEARRWHKRRDESDIYFSKSTDAVSSKKLRAAIRLRKEQGAVWDSVAEEQEKISKVSGISAFAAESPSSLQLSYEIEEIDNLRREICEKIDSQRVAGATGVVWAINGEISHADLYASEELFTKLWRKLVQAAALEAISESHSGRGSDLPSPNDIGIWLALKTTPREEVLPPRTRVTIREEARRVRFDTFETGSDGPLHVSVQAI